MIFWLLGGAALIMVSAKPAREFVLEKISLNQNWNRWDKDFKAAGLKYSVPWQWLKAIALNESTLGTYPSVALGIQEPKNVEGSKSQDGKSWGLMQVTLTTGRGLDPFCTEEKLNNPLYSIDLGAKYVAQMAKRFPQVEVRYVEWVIKSYNQGPGNTDKERAGKISGYAGEYWDRFKRNLIKVEADT